MHAIAQSAFRRFSGKREKDFLMIYIGLVLFSIHWSLVMYINSSFLGQFVSPNMLGILYALGSALSLVVFFNFPHYLKQIGNYKLTIISALIEIAAMAGMAFATNALFASIFFLMHFVIVPMILFHLDIFVEEIIGTEEKQTGSRRGLYLSLGGFAGAVAPPITGSLLEISNNSFSSVYIVSALFLVPFIAIIYFHFKQFKDAEYIPLSIAAMTNIFKSQPNTRNVVIIGLHLQLFFTWMVIYTPLYLAHVVGFTWIEIGLIMFVALSAYVIFEYPIGIIADRYIGEKEMMAFGFLLIAVSVSWFAFIPNAGIEVWMVAMFITRVGASFIESTSESYFFKHTKSADTHAISLFRMMRPLSSILGAILGSIALYYLEFNLMFIVLALLMIPGFFFTMKLKDSVSLREQQAAISRYNQSLSE